MDKLGTRWRCFSTGEPPQENWVNMSVLEPFLRVLSHGGTTCPSPEGHLDTTQTSPLLSCLPGYQGDGMNDIIVFSSCFLPESRLGNYQYVMDNLFR